MRGMIKKEMDDKNLKHIGSHQFINYDPNIGIMWAYRMLYLLGGFGIIMELSSKSLPWIIAVEGIAMIVFGYFVHKRKSFTALAIITFLYSLSSIILFLRMFSAGIPLAGIVFRLTILAILINGLLSIRIYRANKGSS